MTHVKIIALDLVFMGLRLAVKFHTEDDLVNAEKHYQRALAQGQHEIILFQNYGALLRRLGKIDDARALYEKGLHYFPDNLDILANQANSFLEEQPAFAFSKYLYIFRCRLAGDDKLELKQKSLEACTECLLSMKLFFLAYQLLISSKDYILFGPSLSLSLLRLMHRSEIRDFLIDDDLISFDLLVSEIEGNIGTYSVIDQIKIRFGLARKLVDDFNHEAAINQFNLGQDCVKKNFASLPEDERLKLQKVFNSHNWNLANSLVKTQKFEKGWSLFDFGLLTPAPGPQRWQRALFKPFSNQELPLWKGQSLTNCSILLLEEQGIGDTMQFISLIPRLFNYNCHVGLLVTPRLLKIYQLSFQDDLSAGRLSLYISADVTSKALRSSSFNYQLPIGSICQYLFTHPRQYHPRTPILKSDSQIGLREEYLSQFPSASRVIGISWRGGGKADRIKQKSIPEHLFLDILRDHPDVVFVSLQYGEDGSTISKWMSLNLNTNLIFDKRFNALKNMHSWLGQVNACDAVISVANTTIHGSGGLNIPTSCLLSRYADWRWLNDPKILRSYWYPSVGIARQCVDTGSWNTAVANTRDWIASNCEFPDALQYL